MPQTNQFISFDFNELKAFQKDLKKMTKNRFRRVMINTLNNQAFATMFQAKNKEIPSSMNTRGKFNQRFIRVRKADFKMLEAKTGAVKKIPGAKKMYNGLRNIELGKRVKNPGIPTVDQSRGGSINKRVPKRLTYAGLKDIRTIDGSSAPKQIAKLSRQNFKGTMRIKSGLKMRKGFYKFSAKKIPRKWVDSKGNTRKGKGHELLLIKQKKRKTFAINKNMWLWRSTKGGASAKLTERYYKRNMKKMFIFTKKR
jgi:hypothetical protein